jgi:hypothetical protein
MIVNEEFEYLLDLLPSAYKPHGFIHQDEKYAPNNLGIDGGVDDGPDGGSDDGANN